MLQYTNAGYFNNVNGGAGDDFLSGSNDPEITDNLNGGAGNDTIVGNRGNDIKIGGSGNDRFIWNNGDGSDTIEGDGGFDFTEVNGAVDNGDNFELRANGHRTEFERLNLGNFVLDVDNVEQFEINGGGGDDTLTVKDLTGTDVEKIFFEGGEGNDVLDGSLSTVETNGNGGSGHDLLSGSNVPGITDSLNGGAGNDTIVGNRGNDIKIGGSGNDRFIWNNGDGSDTIEGDGGFDFTEVNGAVDNGDNFELRANGHRTEFERLNLGNFVLDVDNVEQFEINGGGGDDTLTVKDLTGTDVQKIFFEGGDGNDVLDGSLSTVETNGNGGSGHDLLSGSNIREITDNLNGGDGDDTIIGNRGNDIKIGGEGDDRLIWNNGDGSDTIEGDGGYDVVEVNGAVDNGDNFELRANGHRAEFERLNLGNFVLDVDNVERFEINGGGGDDTLTVKDLTGTDVAEVVFTGGEGNDILDASQTYVNVTALGGAGNDSLTGGQGNDFLDGGEGNDTLIGGAGADIFFVGSPGIDAIADFNFYEGDKIQLSTLELGISDFSFEQISYNLNDQTLYYGETALVTSANSLDAYNPADYIDLV